MFYKTTGCPKKKRILVKIKIGNIVLIIMGKENKLQIMYNHLEKAKVLSFLHVVVHFL